MAEQRCCQAPDCANPVHARGYCRRHYGRIWRREKRGAGGNSEDREKRDRLRALERELLRARQMYDVVVGTPADEEEEPEHATQDDTNKTERAKGCEFHDLCSRVSLGLLSRL